MSGLLSVIAHSVSRPSSCVSVIPRRPPSSSRRERWSLRVPSPRTIHGSPRANTLVSSRSSASTPNSLSSRFRISLVAVTLSSPFVLRVLRTATVNSAVMSLRHVVRRCRSRLSLTFVAVVPWSDLPYDQAQGRAPHLRLGEDCPYGCEGNYPFPALTMLSLGLSPDVACVTHADTAILCDQ